MLPLNADPLPWLLENDLENPSIRYFALRDLLDQPDDASDVCCAREAIMEHGPVPQILAAQHSDGYWSKAGTGYSPKYRGTIWQIIFLAELGADPHNEQVQHGCGYLLRQSLAPTGAFSCNQPPRPSGAVHCLNGNLLYALLSLGYADDPRVQIALNWQAQAIVGAETITYYQSGTAGPGFACGINLGQPCGWGATKAMRALVAIPEGKRTAVVQQAIELGINFLLQHDLATADFPYVERISSTWFKFGFPLSYWSDILETVSVLVDMGYGSDPRLAKVLQLILSKQDSQGRWKLENSLKGKMWVDIEKKGQPSKWITLRVLRMLKRAGFAVV